MKKEIKKIYCSYIILIGFALIITVGCKKSSTDDTPKITGPVPVIETVGVTNVIGTCANSGGIIATDNGVTITSRGVCWSTSTNPTIANDKTTDGAGAGIFTSAVTGLTPGTTYYLRAYATNSNGTGYGSAMSFTTSNLSVGENYQGGIVAYIFSSGQTGYVPGQVHGIICAPNDQSDGVQWYNGSNMTTGATASDYGGGITNTNTIIAAQGSGNYAAKICSDLVLGGYSDWYLGNSSEMFCLFVNRMIIPGLNFDSYWTSSEYNSSEARFLYIADGTNMWLPKNTSLHVRAIRKF